MPFSVPDVTRHIEKLTSRWYDHPEGRPLIEGLLQIVDDRLAQPLRDLNDQLELSTATGRWLDDFGALFNLPRPLHSGTPLSDIRYRRLLTAKVQTLATNTSVEQGEAAIMNVFDLAYFIDIEPPGQLRIFAQDADLELLQIVLDNNLWPKPAGVRIIFGGTPYYYTHGGNVPANEDDLSRLQLRLEQQVFGFETGTDRPPRNVGFEQAPYGITGAVVAIPDSDDGTVGATYTQTIPYWQVPRDWLDRTDTVQTRIYVEHYNASDERIGLWNLFSTWILVDQTSSLDRYSLNIPIDLLSGHRLRLVRDPVLTT